MRAGAIETPSAMNVKSSSSGEMRKFATSRLQRLSNDDNRLKLEMEIEETIHGYGRK